MAEKDLRQRIVNVRDTLAVIKMGPSFKNN